MVTDVSGEIVQWRMTCSFPPEATTWLTCGGVPSYLKLTELDAVFPARSVQVPDSVALSVGGPSKSPALQLSIPAPGSVPLAVAATAWLYQPFASGGLASATVTVGGVESYWSENVALALLPALSAQLPETVALAPSGPP